MAAGLLIAFEGIDGTGKSTQIRLLAERLVSMGCDVVTTREPTDGPCGRRIRELFVSRASVSREEELELFLADRRQHVDEVIEPAIAAGKIVLTDRYYLSTIAYQGAAGLDPAEIRRKNDFAPKPDLVILLILPPEESAARIQGPRGQELNAFEQIENLHKVAAEFDRMNEDFIRRIDATLTVPEVHEQVVKEVRALLQANPVEKCGD